MNDPTKGGRDELDVVWCCGGIPMTEKHECRTCRHWIKHIYGTWGNCVKLISDEQELFDLDQHFCERDTEVQTHPNFGCVLWEADHAPDTDRRVLRGMPLPD